MIVLLLSLAFGYAQEELSSAFRLESARVEVSVDRDEVQIADPFTYEIRVVADPRVSVELVEIGDQIGPFFVLDRREALDVPMLNGSNLRAWEFEFQLESLETGGLRIPTFDVILKSNSERRVLQTDSVSVRVIGVVEEAADLTQFNDIADVQDVEDVDETRPVWVYWLSGVAAATLLLGSFIFVMSKRIPTVTPAVWAEEQIAGLARRDLAQLEIVIRQFIQEEFRIPAASLSPTQVVNELDSKNIPQNELDELREFFDRTERVKFGGLELSDTEVARLFNHATKLIRLLDQVNGGD